MFPTVGSIIHQEAITSGELCLISLANIFARFEKSVCLT
jgi:hypothetical protein